MKPRIPSRTGVALAVMGLLIGCKQQPATTAGTFTLVTFEGATTLPAPSAGQSNQPAWLLPPGLSLPITEPRLERRLASIDFAQMPFEKALEKVRDAAGVNLLVDWHAIEAAGIDRRTPITLRLHDVPAVRVLEAVLRLAGSAPTATLTHWVNGGIVTVGLSENEPTVTAVYDIKMRALAMKKHADQIATYFPPKPFTPWLIVDKRTGNVCWPSPYGLNNITPYEEYADALTALIRDHIAVGTWHEDGGTLGNLRENGGYLIVEHTPRVQQQIQGLLTLLDR